MSKDKLEKLEKENNVLRRSLNRLHRDVSNGEMLDSEWVTTVIQEEVHSRVLDAHIKMLDVYKRKYDDLKKELDKLKE